VRFRSISIQFVLFYSSVFLKHMPNFFGHTHTKRERRGSSMADRGGFPGPDNALERGVGVTPDVHTANNGRSVPTKSAIADLAHSYWQARGCQGGSDWDDWFRAERELKERSEQ
jgi:hypothetical protein